MSCVMFCFSHALLCLLSFKSFLWCALCLPLSVSLVPSWCAPLCSSPSLSHLASSLPSLLTCSSVSVYLVCVFPSLLVWSLFVIVCLLSLVVHAPVHAPAHALAHAPVSYLVGFVFFWHFFHVWFELWHWFEVCIFALLLCLVLGCYFVFHCLCLLLVFVNRFSIKLAFCSPDPCLPV